MLPPKSAFTTPVLSSAPDGSPSSARARQGGGGPVIEYVRGPMRINMAPVASAAPSDTGAPRGGGGGKRRHRDRFVGGGGGGGGVAGEARGARTPAERRADRRAERLEKKRRRRRRRKRNQQMGLPADGPVSFFSPVGGGGGNRPALPAGNGAPPREGAGGNGNGQPNGNGAPVQLGPDGQPLPPRPKRDRKPIGPDASGLGPDGTPWDPERRGKRAAERQAPVNTDQGSPVEAQTPSAPVENQTESPTE
jgi:hypothetical protein